MKALNRIRAIAFGLAFSGAGALADTADADEPCAGVDTDVTDARQQQYAELVTHAITENLNPSDVKIHNFLENGNWSAVYASVPVADDAMFFFEEADGGKEFREVWGGWADPSERRELIQWAEDLGAPAKLASCFAYVVTNGTSAE